MRSHRLRPYHLFYMGTDQATMTLGITPASSIILISAPSSISRFARRTADLARSSSISLVSFSCETHSVVVPGQECGEMRTTRASNSVLLKVEYGAGRLGSCLSPTQNTVNEYEQTWVWNLSYD
jgi:hypothetical protein